MSTIALAVLGSLVSPIAIFGMITLVVAILLGGYSLLLSVGVTMLLMVGLGAAVLAARSWSSVFPDMTGSYASTEVVFVLVAAWTLQAGIYLDFFEQAVVALDSSMLSFAALVAAVGSAAFSTAAFIGGLIGIVLVVSVVSALQLFGQSGGERAAPWIIRTVQLWLLGSVLYLFSGAVGELIVLQGAPAAVVGGVHP